MSFPPLSDDIIGQICEHGRAGIEVNEIAERVGVSPASVIKYLKKSNLTPYWGTKRGQSAAPIPSGYAAPSTVPQKLEGRSVLSPEADASRDEVRILQSALDKFRIEASMQNLTHPQPSMDFSDLLRAFNELRSQEAPGVSALGDEIRQLRENNVLLNQKLTESRAENAMREMEARLSRKIAEATQAARSERIEELKFLRETVEASPEFVGRLLDKTRGQLVERGSRVAEAMGIEVGGLTGEPRKMKSISFPQSAGPGRDSTEVIPYSESELRELQARLDKKELPSEPSEDRELPEEPLSERESADAARYRRLAANLAESRQKNAELQDSLDRMKKTAPKKSKSKSKSEPKVVSITAPSKPVDVPKVISTSESE